MNVREYAEYVRLFQSGRRFVFRFDPIEDSEPHFSWSSCDYCDRPGMAGNRTDCYWLAQPEKIVPGVRNHVDAEHRIPWAPSNQPLAVCDDCIYFQEYGRLDDATMLTLSPVEYKSGPVLVSLQYQDSPGYVRGFWLRVYCAGFGSGHGYTNTAQHYQSAENAYTAFCATVNYYSAATGPGGAL